MRAWVGRAQHFFCVACIYTCNMPYRVIPVRLKPQQRVDLHPGDQLLFTVLFEGYTTPRVLVMQTMRPNQRRLRARNSMMRVIGYINWPWFYRVLREAYPGSHARRFPRVGHRVAKKFELYVAPGGQWCSWAGGPAPNPAGGLHGAAEFDDEVLVRVYFS